MSSIRETYGLGELEHYDYCIHCGSQYFMVCSCKKGKEAIYKEELKRELINDIRQALNEIDVSISVKGEVWA